MVAYDIDTAAVLETVRYTETELAELVSVPTELQRSVHAVEAALSSSRVASAFTAYGTGELLPVWRSVLSRAEDAVHNVTQAVAEYLRADGEMRARAEAAAAAVPKPFGQRTEHAPAPAAPPIVPQLRPALLPGGGGSGLSMDPAPEPETLVPLPGPPPWQPGWLFRPALPGRPPVIIARDLMLRLRLPCPGHWHPHPGFRPHWWGPAYPPGGWHPRWPEPGRPPGAWFPRWPEPGLPPQGRFPWWPARPLPGLIPLPKIVPPPDHLDAWPVDNNQLPFALAVDGPEAVFRPPSSRKWGLT